MKRTSQESCQNPLFYKWITELYEEAKANNKETQYGLRKALKSLKKYPLKLNSGRECIILEYFGDKLCSILDKKLADYKSKNEIIKSKDSNDGIVKKSRKNEDCLDVSVVKICDKKNDKTVKELKPNNVLSKKNDNKQNKLKDVIKVQLENLTDNNSCLNIVAISKEPNPKNKIRQTVRSDSFCLLPGTFDIILLVDIHETSGYSNLKSDEGLLMLTSLNTAFEVRHLNVGDFTWIARCRRTNRELVLPYIVERKRMDDLSSSIKDQRFHEQKFRLKQSGLKNIIYLLESFGKSLHTSIPETTLHQAVINTLVQDGFSLKYNNSHKESMTYLSTITTKLVKVYENKRLMYCKKCDLISITDSSDTESLMSFSDFNKAASKIKILNVKDTFLRQLLLLKGISLDKAMAIVNRYPTPQILSKVLKRSGENFLADIKYGPMNRQIGSVCSNLIYQFYTTEMLK